MFVLGRLVWRKMNYNEINSDFQSVTAFCKNYFYSTSCGFWVAEQSSFCGKEIVGTVGIHQPQNRRIDQLKENNFSGGLELRVSINFHYLLFIFLNRKGDWQKLCL